jgi:predicted DNA binding CopG/RHH family protein
MSDKLVSIRARIPQRDYDEIKRMAGEEKLPIADIVRKIIEDYMMVNRKP